ncbi:MAG: hypothetical protein ED559_00265 [Phycisphaera sp.]|nr:MAG: hypothetical protein ED559_00265 [Phycisphaera sp.]
MNDEELIPLILKDRDMRCPRCNYNLRGGRSMYCPECGSLLAINRQAVCLAHDVDYRHTSSQEGLFRLSVVGLGLATVVFLVLSASNATGGRGFNWMLMVLASGLVVHPVLIVLAFVYKLRMLQQSKVRWQFIAAACWWWMIVPCVLVIVFSLWSIGAEI